MPNIAPSNRCRACGATSYKPVLVRDGTGAMRPSQRYQCTGCDVTFTVLAEWRAGEPPMAYANWVPGARVGGPASA